MDKNKLGILLSISLLTMGACTDHPVDQTEPQPVQKQYEEFCDFSVPLIERYCTWYDSCGYFSKGGQEDIDGCFEFFYNFSSWRCGVQLTRPDEFYNDCLEAFDTLSCSSQDNFPAGCETFI